MARLARATHIAGALSGNGWDEPWVRPYLAGLVQDPTIASARRSLLPLSLRESGGATLPSRDLADRLLEERVVLVAGPPGSGKSALLASLAYDYALYALNLGEADLAQCVLCEERRLPIVVLGSGFGVPSSEGEGGLGVPTIVIVDGPERPLTPAEKRELVEWVESALRSGGDVRVVVGLREADLPEPLTEVGLLLRLDPLGAEAAAAMMEARLAGEGAHLAGLLARWDLWDLTQGPRLLGLLCDLAGSGSVRSRRELMEALLARLQDLSAAASLAARSDPPPPPLGKGGSGGAQPWLGKGGSGAVTPAEGGAVERQAWSQVARAWQGGAGRLLWGLISCGAVAQDAHGRATWSNAAVRDYLAALSLREEVAAGKAVAALLEGSLAEWGRPLSLAQELVGASPVLLDWLLQHPAGESLALAVRCARDSGLETLLVQRATPLRAWRGLVPLARELNRAGLFREAKAVLEQAMAQGGNGPTGAMMGLEDALAEACAGLGLPPVGRDGNATGNPTGEVDRVALVAAFDRERRALLAGEAQARWRGGQERLLEAVVEWELLGAAMAMEAGRSAEARRRVARAARLARSPGQWLRCGDVYSHLGRAGFAASLWERAARAAPEAPEAPEGWVALSRLAESAGRLEEACRMMAQAVEIDAVNPDLQVEEARLLQRAGSPLLARARLERCLWLRRDYPPALATMGELLLAEGKVEEGLGYLRRATETAPHDPELWGRLALRLLETGRAREGEAALRAALERQPARADWLNRLGLLLLDGRRHGEALALFEAALTQAPGHPVYRYNRATALAARAAEVPGSEEEALEEFSSIAGRQRPARFARSGGAEARGGVELPGEGMLWDMVAAEAHRQRGVIFDRRGDFARAAEEFQRASVLVPEAPDYRLLESLAWGRLDDQSRRMALLRQSAEMWPLDATVLLRLGEALEEAGEVAEALVLYRRASELEPARGEIWLARGRCERLAGQLGVARESLGRGLALLPRDARVRKEFSLVLEETGAAEEAYEGYREAARLAVSDASLWVCVGRLARRLDRPADSLAALRTAAGLDRLAAEPHIELGLSLCLLGRYEEALGELREALTRDPASARGHYHLSVVARRLDRVEEADRHLAYASSLRPGAPWSRPPTSPGDGFAVAAEEEAAHDGAAADACSLAELRRLLDLGDAASALCLAERAARDGGLGVTSLARVVAEARERLGDLEGAVAALTATDQATPADLRWQALLLRRLGSFDGALEAVRRAGRGHRWPALWRDQAAILAAKGSWQEAIALYERALPEGGDLPADERAWWLLEAGDVLRKLGDAAGAAERYNRGLSLGGPQAALWRRWAEVSAELGRSDEALAALERATALDPGDHAAWFMMAGLLQGQGSVAEALEAVGRACDAEPGRPEYALLRGRLLRALGRSGEAARWLLEAAQGPGDPQVWGDLGWALLETEEPDRAEECFVKGLDGDPQSVPCLCGLARVRLRQSRDDEALALLRQAARLFDLDPARGADERRQTAGALEACGAPAEALPLRRALARDPGLASDWLQLARTARVCGQGEESRSAILEALRREETAVAHRLAAAMIADQGQPEQALAHLRRALDLEPEDQAGWVELARLLVQEGHWEEVVRRWERQVLEGSAAEAGWWLASSLAVARLHLGEIGQARKLLDQAGSMVRRQPVESPGGGGAPGGPAAALACWQALVDAHGAEPGEAMEQVGDRMAAAPAGAEALYALGLARLSAGDMTGARDALAQAVALAPSGAIFRLGYARALLTAPNLLLGKEGEEGRLEGDGRSSRVLLARQQLSALEGRGGVVFRRQVAAAWLQLGDAESAARALGSVAGETRAAADEVHWAEALLAGDRYEEAANVLRMALARDGEQAGSSDSLMDGLEVEARYLLARALLGSGEAHEAVGVLLQVTQRQPDRADVAAELGRAWEKVGRYEAARQAYERALAISPGHQEVEDRLLALDAKEQLERAARAGRGARRS